MLRYEARYLDGYYVVIDTATGNVVPSHKEDYKKYRDGYLWDYAAYYAARDLNKLVEQNDPSTNYGAW